MLLNIFVLINLFFSSFLSNTFLNQDGIIVENAKATYHFGKSITYEASFRSSYPIREIYLFINHQGDETFSIKVIPNANGEIIYQQDVRLFSLRPFTKITYWYQVLLANNTNFKSENFVFEYRDDRFTWQSLTSPDFQVHWYNRDLSFGQMALSTANRGLIHARSFLNVDLPSPVKIFIYNSSSDFLSALPNSEKSWIAGHTSPDLNTILITIPNGPEQKMELERQIPHEIMHVLQYAATGYSYKFLPVWLIEGLASISELYPNPEYQRVLMDAAEKRKMPSVSRLCDAFPNDASSAYLAYAQSASFVQFIHQNYGTKGIRKLIQQYQNGLGCEEGVLSAFGNSLPQLELRWQKKSLDMNPWADVFYRLTPFLAMGILILSPLFVIISNISRSNRKGQTNGNRSG